MNKTKKILTVCCILLGLGFVLYLTGFALGGRVVGISLGSNGINVRTVNQASAPVTYREEELELNSFSNLDLNIDFADVTLKESDHFGLSYKVADNVQLSCEVEDNCLTINTGENAEIQISFGITGLMQNSTINNSITILIPAGHTFEDVKADFSTVDFTANDITADSLSISNNFGKLDMGEVSVTGPADFRMETGNVNIDKGSFDTLSVKQTFGEFISSRLKAGNLSFRSETTEITLDNLEADSIDMENTFGKLDMGEVSVAGPADFRMETCDVNIDKGSFDTLSVKQTFGEFISSRLKVRDLSLRSETTEITLDNLGADSIDMENTFGSVDINIEAPLDSYQYDLSTQFGTVIIGDKDMGASYSSPAPDDSVNKIKIKGETVDITIKEAK